MMNPTQIISAEDAMDDFAAPLPAQTPSRPAAVETAPPPARPRAMSGEERRRNFIERLYDRLEAFVSKLSMRDNFWNSICSMIWLPLAFFSGIRMKEIDANSFVARAVLPFRRFNRNWYRAMAGGALLANSEIAGGAYVFGICGADYTVVCKHLEYKFLRPCFGPAVYRISARENIKELMATGAEFNITTEMDILQQAGRMGEKDKRVGQCVATFHVTPKKQHLARRMRGRR
jgi:acyl-coenzyme A thioesterase PaaI-like protein